MANVKISGLTAASAATGTNEFEINESGTSKKVTGSQILAYVKANTTAGDIGAISTSSAPSGTIVGTTDTQTLTSKRINPRFVSDTTNSATPSVNSDTTDIHIITGQSNAITSFTTNLTGTPVRGQKLWISITGTTDIAITWGASFESSTVTLPTTTVSTTRLDVGFVWNYATSKWRCVATA